MGSEYSLFDDFELQGFWWLPDSPDRKVPGTLFRKNQQLRLELLGELVQVPLAERGKVKPPPKPEIILGQTVGAGYCTLFKAIETGFSLHFMEVSTTCYIAQMLFIGVGYTSPSDLAFTSVETSHTSMEQWMCYRTLGHDMPQWQGDVIEAKAEYRSFPKMRFEIPASGAVISIEPGYASTGTSHSLNMKHTALLGVELNGDRSLGRYLDVLTACRNLLALFVGAPIYARSITVEGEEIEPHPGYRKTPRARVYFSQGQDAKEAEVAAHEMLVTYPSVQAQFGAILNNWLSKADELQTVCELYFGHLYNKGTFLRFRFLSLVQALESYGRLRHDSLEKIGPLKDVLQPVIGSLTGPAIKLVTSDVDRFLQELIATRNYLTHYLKKYEAKALRGTELYLLNERLHLLLTILLFKEAGLDEPLIVRLLAGNHRIMMFRHLHPDGPLPTVTFPEPPAMAEAPVEGALAGRLPADRVLDTLEEGDREAREGADVQP